MKLNVIDGEGVLRTIVAGGVATLTDRSGTIAASGVSQVVMAANADRGGWFFQNLSSVPMWINEMGVAASEASGVLVRAGATFPPPGYPVTVAAIAVRGDDSGPEVADAVGGKFTAREW